MLWTLGSDNIREAVEPLLGILSSSFPTVIGYYTHFPLITSAWGRELEAYLRVRVKCVCVGLVVKFLMKQGTFCCDLGHILFLLKSNKNETD